jgi:hypothetical protein
VEANAALAVAVDMRTGIGPDPELAKLGDTAADRLIENDPRGAGTILETIAPVEKEPEKLLGKKRDVWERVVAAGPEDPDAASHLAVVYEAQSEPEKCEKLLSPLEKRLGTREGARILGHIYTQQNKLEEANALLKPYLEGRLDRMRKAEKAYEHAVIQARDQAVEQVNKGKATDFPAERHQRAMGAEKRRIEEEYLREKTKDDQGIQEAYRALVKELSIVPVAIDYGIVQLRRAQTMRDEAQRRAELEKAKQTFLSIKTVAGQDDAYRMFLGQVHYWLGEHDEGRKLFDELLDAQKRSYLILSQVSHVLREVGATAEARKLAEEAFERAPDPKAKRDAAAGRAVMYTDLDDEIAWLQKSDVSDPHVKGLLNSAQGEKAREEGKEEAAAGYLREAVAVYEKLPPSPSMYNNGALACYSLYQVTGEQDVLDKKVQMLEKAIAMDPSDTIILHNVADSLQESALRRIVGPAIDLSALRMMGSLDLLPYLYQDKAGKQKYVDLLNKHAGLAKARGHYERLLVMSPKQEHGYVSLHALYRYTHDLEGLRALAKRLQTVELDRAESERRTRDFFAGKEDDKQRKKLQAAHDRAQSNLLAVRKGNAGATLAVAATQLAQTKTALAELDMPANSDEIVALAEEAHAAAPSNSTRNSLINALLHRAHRKLLAQQPEYAQVNERVKHSLGYGMVLAVEMFRDEKVRQVALADKDVQRVLPMLKEQFARFPDAPSEWEWAILKAAGDPEAGAMAGAFKSDYAVQERDLNLLLAPLSATAALQAYFSYQAVGEDAKGIEILKQYAARGVPLPFDP